MPKASTRCDLNGKTFGTFVASGRAKLVSPFLGPASALSLDIMIKKEDYSVGKLNKPRETTITLNLDHFMKQIL